MIAAAVIPQIEMRAAKSGFTERTNPNASAPDGGCSTLKASSKKIVNPTAKPAKTAVLICGKLAATNTHKFS
jgi:hypothetical protein